MPVPQRSTRRGGFQGCLRHIVEPEFAGISVGARLRLRFTDAQGAVNHGYFIAETNGAPLFKRTRLG
jgi:hypothetical protein